jgi:hypothetical protein
MYRHCLERRKKRRRASKVKKIKNWKQNSEHLHPWSQKCTLVDRKRPVGNQIRKQKSDPQVQARGKKEHKAGNSEAGRNATKK